MDEESEKIMALKKVYAEIILNTAKEAAARIMVSERKTHGYQHDLSLTKDEALRLLLRLKQTMDCKINEVEMKSQDQQRKIDELEAQLQEAEDIVSNLREELNEAHSKLDKFTDNQVFAESNVMVKGIGGNGSLRPVNQEAVLAIQAEKYNGAQGHLSVNSSFEEYRYSEEPEVPSIIIKRKKPEMYQNRWAQTIRACDRKLLNKNAKESQEDEEGERICVDIKEDEDDEGADLMKYLKLLRTRRTRASKYKAVLPGSYEIDESENEDKGRQSNSSPTASSSVSEMGALQKAVFCLGDDGTLTKVRADGVDKDKEAACSVALDDDKVVDSSDELVSSPKDTLLKYTFQRKRKRDTGVVDYNDLLLDESPLRKRVGTKQNAIFTPVKCTQVTGSLQGGRRRCHK